MFRYKMIINEDSNFDGDIMRLSKLLSTADVDGEDKELIIAQITNSINQYRKHLTLNGGKNFSMNRTFQGKGFNILLIIRNKKESLIKKIFKIVGI